MSGNGKNGHGATGQWAADEMEQQLLQQLGKDHISVDTIKYLIAAGGQSRVLPILGRIAGGTTEGTTCYEQRNAIYVLGMMRDPAAVPWLTAVLSQEDVDLQILAVRALGRIGGEQALEPVRRLYNGPRRCVDQGVSGAAKSSLADGLTDTLSSPIPPALALEMRDVLQPAAPRAANGATPGKHPPLAPRPDPTHAAFRSRARS